MVRASIGPDGTGSEAPRIASAPAHVAQAVPREAAQRPALLARGPAPLPHRPNGRCLGDDRTRHRRATHDPPRYGPVPALQQCRAGRTSPSYRSPRRRIAFGHPLRTAHGRDMSPLPMTPMTPPTILVVDDVLEVRRLTRRFLEAGGYRVLEAGDGGQALACLQHQGPVDLVLTDVRMPNMDGTGSSRLTSRRSVRGCPSCSCRATISISVHPPSWDSFSPSRSPRNSCEIASRSCWEWVPGKARSRAPGLASAAPIAVAWDGARLAAGRGQRWREPGQVSAVATALVPLQTQPIGRSPAQRCRVVVAAAPPWRATEGAPDSASGRERRPAPSPC